MSRTTERQDRTLARQLARRLGFLAIPLPCYSGQARRRRSAVSTTFLALARESRCRAARQTRVHPLCTERGFLTRTLPEVLPGRSLSVSLSLSLSLAHNFSLRSRPAREAELHAYNPFARPSFLPTLAPPVAALRVVNEDNDATTAATRDPAMPPLPRTT